MKNPSLLDRFRYRRNARVQALICRLVLAWEWLRGRRYGSVASETREELEEITSDIKTGVVENLWARYWAVSAHDKSNPAYIALKLVSVWDLFYGDRKLAEKELAQTIGINGRDLWRLYTGTKKVKLSIFQKVRLYLLYEIHGLLIDEGFGAKGAFDWWHRPNKYLMNNLVPIEAIEHLFLSSNGQDERSRAAVAIMALRNVIRKELADM